MLRETMKMFENTLFEGGFGGIIFVCSLVGCGWGFWNYFEVRCSSAAAPNMNINFEVRSVGPDLQTYAIWSVLCSSKTPNVL